MSVHAGVYSFELTTPNVMTVRLRGEPRAVVHYAEPVRSEEELEMRAAWWVWENA